MDETAEITIKRRKEDLNQFTFTGHMIARRETVRGLTVFFRATTLHGKKARSYTNSMRLLVFDKEVANKVNAIPLRTKVHVTGYITSRTKTEERVDTKDVGTNGQAAKVSRAPRTIEVTEQAFVMSDIVKVDDNESECNLIEITGSVYRAFVSRGGSIIFIVAARRDGHLNRIKASVLRDPDESINYISLMASGTRVQIIGHCSAHSVDDNGEIKYLESIVIDEIKHC